MPFSSLVRPFFCPIMAIVADIDVASRFPAANAAGMAVATEDIIGAYLGFLLRINGTPVCAN